MTGDIGVQHWPEVLKPAVLQVAEDADLKKAREVAS